MYGKSYQMNQMPQNVQITPVQCNMPQNVQITPVQCNKSNHQNEIIRMLCLSAQCQENSAFCFLCSVKGHLKCREESILAQDIPKLLTDIQELKLDMVALAQKFNQQFKSALSRIEELDMQISQYRETPNLTNLNQIGKMLRTFNQQQFVNNIVVSLNKLQTGFERKHNKYQGNFSPKNYIKPYPKYS